MKHPPIAAASLLLVVMAHAGPRTSASYNVPTDTTDAGGQRSASTSYSNDGSLGGVAGISTVAAPAETVKCGYIGQLYEITGLTLTATQPSVNEGGTLQLGGARLLDDATTLAVPAASIAWSVLSGPLTNISTGGLATAGLVYQNTTATAQGNFSGNTSLLNLTVLDILPDNYGSYAADGLDDSWQYQFFGLNNFLAAPLQDPDGDGQNNLFEFTAGLVPTNALSHFTLSIAAVSGQPTHKTLTFAPIVEGRTYSVMSSSTLVAESWSAANVSSPVDSGAQRSVTDTGASGAKMFYRIDITKP